MANMVESVRAEERVLAQAEADARCHSRVAGFHSAATTTIGDAQQQGAQAVAEQSVRADAAEARATSTEAERQMPGQL
eukprot:11200370-Lingulodinium_polyedra.AAC.1